MYANYNFKNYIHTQFDENNWNFYLENTKKNPSGILLQIFRTQFTTLFEIARAKIKLVLKLPYFPVFKTGAGFFYIF